MNDIIIRYIWFPDGVNGATLPDCNGDYNIYINRNLCFNQQEKAIEHEKEHIRNGDFGSFFEATEMEKKLKNRMG